MRTLCDYHNTIYNIGSILLVIIPTSVSTPTAGQAYSLNCYLTEVTGMVTYQWFKGLASNGTQVTNTHQLEFSPLKASDAGLYTCRATLDSVEIEETTTVTITRKCSNVLSLILIINNNTSVI